MKIESNDALDARLAPYVKRETFYNVIVGAAGFVAILLIMESSAYFAIPVIFGAGVGVARHLLRKKMLVIREDYEGAMDARNKGVKYPGKTTKDSPFTELFRKLGH